MMRRLRWLLLLPVVALALTAAGCGGGGNGGQASGEPIKIGTSLPLTGDFSEPGSAAQKGYKTWEKLVNDNGGLLGRPVTVIVKDDSTDQNTIVADYNALISKDNVDLLFGTFSSLLNLPASAVAERNKMLYAEPAGGSPEMFSRGFEYLFFCQQATAPHQADLFSEWVKGLPADERPKTAAFVTSDDPFTQPVIDNIRSILTAAGIKSVYQQVYPIDTKNFDSIANNIAAKKPDLVAHGAGFEDGVGMVRAFIKAGYSPKQFFQTTAPSLGDQYAKAIGKDNTEGVFFAVSYDERLETTGNQDFLDTYHELYGMDETPAEDAADAFATAQVVQAAVEGVGSVDDQKALADWLRANTVETILGPLSWNDKGEPQSAFFLGQWTGGTPSIVLPEDQAFGDLVNPKPAWG